MIELRRRYSGGVQSPSFSRLPAGYQEVEYLESTGTQYIDTEYYPQVDDKIYIDTIIEKIGVSWQGCRKYLDYAYFIGNNSVNNIFWMTFGDKIFSDTGFDNFNKRVLFSIDRLGGYVSLNGNEEKIANWDIAENITKESEFSFILFGRFDTYGNVGLTPTHNINYLFKVERDGKVYREFIPCYRISDRKPGMYDIVNDVFYTNDGTGEFLYGQDVHYNIPPEYQQVEYLESTGTQYIVTNIKPKYGDSYDFTALISAIGYQHSYATIITPLRFGTGDVGTNLYNGQFLVQANGRYNITSYRMSNSGVKKKVVYKWGEKYSAFIYHNDELAYSWEVENSLLNREIDAYLPIFCYYDNGKYSEFAVMQMYEFNYYREDKIIAKLIPCYLKEGNAAGMYDVVNGKFYTNAGTGEFIVGPNVIG